MIAPRSKPLIAALLAAAVSAPGAVGGQSNGGADTIVRQVHAAGAGRAQGGGFALSATAGQTVVGRAGAGTYVLSGGFHRSQSDTDALFMNGFE